MDVWGAKRRDRESKTDRLPCFLDLDYAITNIQSMGL